jgi:hypothetical protein
LGAVRRFFFPAAQNASEKSNSKGTFFKDCGSRAQDEWPQLLAAIEHKPTHTQFYPTKQGSWNKEEKFGKNTRKEEKATQDE